MGQHHLVEKLRELGVFNPDKIGDQSDFIEYEDEMITELGIHIGWRSQLTSRVEDIIRQLIFLQKLHISGQLTAIPESIFHLEKLKHLDLSYNSINIIPDRITGLSDLEYLLFRDNQITEVPEFLGTLEHLQHLDLSNNRINDIHEQALTLDRLENLNLSNNHLRVLPPLQIDQLKTCRIDQNSLEAMVLLDDLPELVHLDMSDNRMKALDHSVSDLVHLETLLFSKNKIVDLGRINNITLRELDASENNITSLEESNLPRLEHLNLSNNQLRLFDNTIINSYHLISINLKANKLNKIKLEGLTRLKQLNLRKNQLDSAVVFGSTPSLEIVDMAENNLKRFPDTILQLKPLKHLILEENLIDTLPEEIKFLENLEGLWLSRNLLTEIPPGLFQLPQLKSLWLNHNQLKLLPDTITNLSLEKISLFHNQLTHIPIALLNLDKITSLNLSDNLIKQLDIPFLTNEMYTFISLENNPVSDQFRDKLELLKKMGTLSTKFIL